MNVPNVSVMRLKDRECPTTFGRRESHRARVGATSTSPITARDLDSQRGSGRSEHPSQKRTSGRPGPHPGHTANVSMSALGSIGRRVCPRGLTGEVAR